MLKLSSVFVVCVMPKSRSPRDAPCHARLGKLEKFFGMCLRHTADMYTLRHASFATQLYSFISQNGELPIVNLSCGRTATGTRSWPLGLTWALIISI